MKSDECGKGSKSALDVVPDVVWGRCCLPVYHHTTLEDKEDPGMPSPLRYEEAG